jgi:diguanylate cyclase (GGDEF)-like protein/PAS domain S-box-containing protein
MSDKELTESPNRLLVQTVWPFVVIVITLLITMMLSLELMSSVRAYVGGESLYSKAQKQAYSSLINYLRTSSEKDYQDFQIEISVPLGDNKARLALNQAKPDLETAYKGFIEGKNHPDDVPGMIRLYRYFGNTTLMKDPIRIWTEADSDILKLLTLGQLIHQKIKMGELDNTGKFNLIQALNTTDQHITPLEEAFSSSIAKVSRQIYYLISALLIGLTSLLMGLGIFFSHRLVFQRLSSSKALRKESKKNLALLRNASDGIHILDSTGNVQEASDAFCAMLGYSRVEIIGMNVTQWDAHLRTEDLPSIVQSYIDKSARSQFETMNLRKDGSLFDVEISVLPIELDGNPLLFCSSRDISERKRSEQQVEHLAYHDQLTGLPNRTLFLDRLSQAMTSSRRYKRFGAVLFVDLDKFKIINDVHGHTIGDQVLKEVARRLTYKLRQTDIVSRFGGDEFVILLPELSTNQQAAAERSFSVAEEIRAALEKPVRIDGQDHLVTSSIGVSLFPKEDEGVEDMIREADIAMYRAKENGRNTLVFFEHDMQAHIAERYAMQKDLLNAFQNDELELHLQSQVDKDGTIIGAEGLVRWRHPTRGLIPPAAFIPLAEETGLIVHIGEWVLRETCRLIAQLNAMGHSLRLAVNVSPRQFRQTNFVTRVREILEETGADPLYLTLEVTENLLVDRAMEAVSSMLILAELGIRFSIDDFGTGYSSLSYLKRLPLNELKIDKSFVQDVPHNANDVALVETILSMSRHLGFEVVAEGVETKDQYEFLSTLGCEYYQGYFFHRPQQSQEWLAQLSDFDIAS